MAKQQALVKIDMRKGTAFVAAMRRASARIVIRNDEDYQRAWQQVEKCDRWLQGDFVTGLKAHKKRLRESYVWAHNLLRDVTVPITQIKALYLGARMEYLEKKERAELVASASAVKVATRRQIKDARRVAKELRKQGLREEASAVLARAKDSTPILAPAEDLVPKSEGSVVTERFNFEIEDIDLIPDRYWSVDESLIRHDVNNFGLNANIPGVRVWAKKKEHTRRK